MHRSISAGDLACLGPAAQQPEHARGEIDPFDQHSAARVTRGQRLLCVVVTRETPHDATSADVMIPRVGELFANRYRIEALLGRGGMGSVYRAHDREVDELVALKILNVQALTNNALERFRREVRLARRVTHRNAARTYDLGEHEGVRYLTMEYIDGHSLRERLRERPSGRLCPSEAVEIALQIADGLAAAHAAGVVHRDLKPGNILIQQDGRVVISDFGIARTAGEQTAAQTQGLLGTPAYMAPEQVEGGQIDARTDLYALGLILVEMLSGALPFHGDNPFALAVARLAAKHPDLATLAGIPPVLLELLHRCLAREPDDRFASALEFAVALAKAGALLETDTLDDPPEADPASHETRSTPHSGSPLSRTPRSSRELSTRALAVLPFRYRGPAEQSFVADALLDVLTDVLSMTRRLKVSGTGATARFADAGDRDPRVLGAELNVDVVVDGTIQLAGKRLRLAARLLDVHTGFQLWSERFDGELGDVFDLQDKLGQRVAEALRVELELIGHGGLDDPEALESYLRARQAKLRWRLRGPDGAVFHYREVLARAPDFRPAIAGHALALIRAWFTLPECPDDYERDWPREAKLAVEQAMAEAPDFPESQIAAASWLVQAGDYRGAAEHLREAVRIAPTCALAHEYLGRLQTEAAQPDEGLRHLELALELDPQLEWCHADIARQRALQGDMAGYREHMDLLFARTDRHHVPAQLCEMRVGAWFRDLDQIRRGLAQLDAHSPNEATRTMRAYGPPLLEPYDAEALASFHARALAGVENGRLRTLLYQLWAEQTAFWSDRERTLAHLESATKLVLVDLAWLDGCPLFAFVRDDPRFIELRARVRDRCEAIWGLTR